MTNFIGILNNIQIYITISLIIIVIILLILVLVLLKATTNVENKYRRLMRGVNNKSLEDLVISYLDKVDEVKKQSDSMRVTYADMDKRTKGCLQKLSMKRYRAFDNVGSDLSYSIALLNYDNDGIILTSIYGRNESTTYAKPIDKGISRYDLSEEEEQVLEDSKSKRLL